MENWEEAWLQHDASEFLLHLSRSIPLLQGIVAQARFLTDEGIISEECLCALEPQESGWTLSQCLHHWHSFSGVLKAFISAPPVLCIPFVRFTYVDRRLRRHNATVQLEPPEVAVPIYMDALSIEIRMAMYRCVACILHQGPTPNSGHYRTLVYCDGGFVIADDDKFGAFRAYPTQEDLTQTYVFCLVRCS